MMFVYSYLRGCHFVVDLMKLIICFFYLYALRILFLFLFLFCGLDESFFMNLVMVDVKGDDWMCLEV